MARSSTEILANRGQKRPQRTKGGNRRLTREKEVKKKAKDCPRRRKKARGGKMRPVEARQG